MTSLRSYSDLSAITKKSVRANIEEQFSLPEGALDSRRKEINMYIRYTIDVLDQFYSEETNEGKKKHTNGTHHVTRHTSHVTRHTSHVTRHTSHVTRQASPVTRTPQHVEVQQSGERMTQRTDKRQHPVGPR